MHKTIDYYDQNADKFVSRTLSVEFTEVQDKFLSYIPNGGVILDFGCGSGRDAKYFLSKGYSVVAIDGSEKLCKIATEITGISVRNMLFTDLDENEKYDGIWACASILHLTKEDLLNVLKKMSFALKNKGYIYSSFKHGDYEGYRGERFFSDFTRESFNRLLSEIPNLMIVEEWISSDVRSDRGDKKWLNIILRKSVTD